MLVAKISLWNNKYDNISLCLQGLHVNDAYNIPDEQGRVLINIGHPENDEDIFLAPQIARVIKPHQVKLITI